MYRRLQFLIVISIFSLSSAYASERCDYGYAVLVTSTNPAKGAIDPNAMISADVVEVDAHRKIFAWDNFGPYKNFINSGFNTAVLAPMFKDRDYSLLLTFKTFREVRTFTAPLNISAYCNKWVSDVFSFPQNFIEIN